MNLSPSPYERARMWRSELLMGYGNVPLLLLVGTLAGLLIALVPLLPIGINSLIRYLATLGTPYMTFGNIPQHTLLSLLPDALLLGLFGAALSACRRLSIRTVRFAMLGTPWGMMRVGLDDLFGLLVGTPLLWFIFYRRGVGILFFMTGAQYMLWPVLGWMMAKI